MKIVQQGDPFISFFLLPMGILILVAIGWLVYNLKFGKTITTIAKRFLNPEKDLEETINASLADMGRIMNIKSVYFCPVKEGLEQIDKMRIWTKEKRHIEDEEEKKYFIQWTFKNCIKELQGDQIVTWRKGGSMVLLPIWMDEKFEGFIVFEHGRRRKIWTNPDKMFLKAFAQLVGDSLTRRKIYDELREKEMVLDTLFQKSLNPIIILDEEGNLIDVNESGEVLLQHGREELLQKSIFDFMLCSSLEPNRLTKTYCYIGNEVKTLLMSVVPIQLGEKTINYGIAQDITELKELEYKLKRNREYYRSLFQYSLDGIFAVDLEGKFMDLNPMAERISGYSKEELVGKPFIDLLASNHIEAAYRDFFRVAGGESLVEEAAIFNKNGYRVELHLMVVPIKVEEEIIGVYGIAKDITEERKIQEKLKYLSYRDALTTVHNRLYFEEELQRIDKEKPDTVGIITCDIDGLKLINDTLGHRAGDELLIKAAHCIRQSIGNERTIARIGGDEFAIMLTGVTEEEVIAYYNHIKTMVGTYNAGDRSIPLNLSVGYAIRNEFGGNVQEVFKEADNHMYREKLSSVNSSRNHIVNGIMKILEERDIVTGEHVSRLTDLIEKVAIEMSIPQPKIKDLKLLAQFHDIGKIGISDTILNKPSALTSEEYNEIKHHCEIGYRIIQAVPSLRDIGQLVLNHHEWWNGRGYPSGLKGEEIPMECRLFAILDAYDVITNERPYKKPLSHQEAIEEIKRWSGVQFDPNLVPRFIEIMEQLREEGS